METQTVALETITSLKENPQDQLELSNVTWKQQIQQHHQSHENNQQKFLKKIPTNSKITAVNFKIRGSSSNYKKNKNNKMESSNINLSKNYNIKLGSSNTNSNNNNNNNNKNYIVINQKQSLWQIFIKASQLMTFLNCLVSDLRTISEAIVILKLTTSVMLINHLHLQLTAPTHICEELLKLHGIDFHDNPLVIEMSKSPFEQSNHYFQPPLQSPPIQRVIHSYGNAVNTKQKDIALFADSVTKGMRMKDLNIRVKGGRIHLKSFSGAEASQLNHYIKPTLEEYKYNCAIIYVNINDILRNKNDTNMNNLPESILEIANTCQSYNIGKIFISVLLPSNQTKVNISQFNEILKHLCSRNNFIDDLWVDGIYLLNSGKAMLGSNFVSELNRYFGKSYNFLGNFMT